MGLLGLKLPLAISLVLCSFSYDQDEALEQYYRLFETNNKEISPPVLTTAAGTIPSWLEGIFLRNGPGSFQISDTGRVLQGWVDGFAKLEQWRIADGKVEFGTKFLRSSYYLRSVKENDVAFTVGLLGDVDPDFEPPDLFSVLVTFSVDPDTLDTKSFSFLGNWKSNLINQFGGRLSHPQHAPGSTDRTYSIVLTPLGIPHIGYRLCLVEITPKDGNHERREVVCDWIPRLTSFHSLGITQDYAILYDSPYYTEIKISKVLAGNFNPDMVWDGKQKTRFLITKLDGSTGLQEVQVPTGAYCGHVVNSWEETINSEELYLYTDWECNDGERFSTLLFGCSPHRSCPHFGHDAAFNPALWRYRFHLKRTDKGFDIIEGGIVGKFDMEVDGSDDVFYGSLMRSNYDYRGKPYCYYYAYGMHESRSEWYITKSDLCRAMNGLAPTIRWWRPGHIPTEPVFVARPGGTAEDDGILLSSVHDTYSNLTYLAVFDARSLELVSTNYAPMLSMFGLHGRFFDFDRQRSY